MNLIPHGVLELCAMVRSLNLLLQSAEGIKAPFFCFFTCDTESSSRSCALALRYVDLYGGEVLEFVIVRERRYSI